MKSEVHVFSHPLEMAQAAAKLIAEVAKESYKTRCKFTLALAGGNTPRSLYQELCADHYAASIPWAHSHLFWGDERFVPVDHPDSNFAMASETLVKHIPIPALNVNPIHTDFPTPEEAAAAYERTMRRLFDIFGTLSADNVWPVFDLILLGVGPDGHTASLFPGSLVLTEQQKWVAATPVPDLNPQVRRITLTLPVINEARYVVFLVTGREKQSLVKTILNNPAQAHERYPAARVSPAGELHWFLVKG